MLLSDRKVHIRIRLTSSGTGEENMNNQKTQGQIETRQPPCLVPAR